MTGGVTNGVIVFPLVLNDLNFSLAVKATKQLSPIFEIRIGLSSSQNVFFSRLLCLSPQFLFQAPTLTPPPSYLYPSLSGVVMMEENLACQWVPPYCITC